jgi:hypothetical protein
MDIFFADAISTFALTFAFKLSQSLFLEIVTFRETFNLLNNATGQIIAASIDFLVFI